MKKTAAFIILTTIVFASNSLFAQDDFFESRYSGNAFFRTGGFALTTNLLDIGLVGGVNIEKNVFGDFSAGVGLGALFNEAAEAKGDLQFPTAWIFVARYRQSSRSRLLWLTEKLAFVRYKTSHDAIWRPAFVVSACYGAPEKGLYGHFGLSLSPYFFFLPLPTIGMGFRF